MVRPASFHCRPAAARGLDQDQAGPRQVGGNQDGTHGPGAPRRAPGYQCNTLIGDNVKVSLQFYTIAFFVSSYYIKRYLEDSGIPKGATRGALIFSIALAIAYLVALAVDRLTQ